MMRARIFEYHSPDQDLTVPVEHPADAGIYVQIFVGTEDAPNGESFGLMIATPSWLLKEILRRGPLVGRHHLIVEEFNWPRIKKFLDDLIEGQEADTWTHLAERIGRVGWWEFEDYRESPIELGS